jgi:hypothetical protein
MSLLSKLDTRFGRFAVPNVTMVLIVGQVFLFLAFYMNPGEGNENVLEKIWLSPEKVLAGEVWRIVTFLFTPPLTNPIFAFFFWYLFYLMGTTLEVSWGAFRYNLFLLIGYLACLIGAFATYFATGSDFPANNGFLYGTVFLAFARLFPEFVMYIMFIIPVKIRWLAMFQWIVYTVSFLMGPGMVRAMVAASVANYFFFFGRDIWRDMKQGHRRMQHQARALKSPARLVHKCCVCGITSDAAPHMQFRYCSKCYGECCYCAEHLQNHEHLTQERAEAAGRKSD